MQNIRGIDYVNSICAKIIVQVTVTLHVSCKDKKHFTMKVCPTYNMASRTPKWCTQQKELEGSIQKSYNIKTCLPEIDMSIHCPSIYQCWYCGIIRIWKCKFYII